MVVNARAEVNPLVRPLDDLLRRRMLLTYFVILLVMYVLALVQALAIDTPRSDARGEVIALVVTAVGLLLALPTPLAGWRYAVALSCVGAAPVTAMLFHERLVAQVWSVVPLMFVAIFVRTWHTAQATRVAVGVLAGAAVAALLVAPAPVPVMWLALYVLSIVGAAEIFGLSNSALLDAAFRDPLTLVWNRAGTRRQAGRLLARARRRRHQVAVIVFDIDDFKGVNDRGGHAVGDRVLTDVARRWREQIPSSGVIGRIGGDEFVVIVGDCDDGAARELADRMSGNLAVDVTYGAAAGRADRRAVETLFAAADRDLYARKRARRT